MIRLPAFAFGLLLSGAVSAQTYPAYQVATQPTANSSNYAASTAFVHNAITGGVSGVASFSGGSTGLTPNVPTTGAITLGGTLAAGFGGTGVTTTSAMPVTATGSTTARTLADRASEYADVRDYGATGNGSTNDSAAFNLAAATGKTVYIPQGSYYLDGTLSAFSNPVLAVGPITFTHYGLPSGGNLGYWQGNVGIYTAQSFTNSTTAQLGAYFFAAVNQTTAIVGESAAIGAQCINNSTVNSCVAGLFQSSAGAGNTTASLSGINPYVLWASGTQGSGSAGEFDVYNNTGTDDAWPLSSTTMKGGLLAVSNGSSKTSYAYGITRSGTSGPFRAGLYFWNGGTSNYDMYADNGSGGARWSIDSSGNAVVQDDYAQTIHLGTFSAAPAISIKFGVGVPSASAMPGSIYINGNEGVPSQGQLWLNTSVGSAGTSWGQIPTTNIAQTWTGAQTFGILATGHFTYDDGSGSANLTGGTVAVTTQAASDNTTKAASTAMVQAARNASLPSGGATQVYVGTSASGTASALAAPSTSGTYLQYNGTSLAWATPSGGGNVSNSGTPTSGQVAVWTGATTIQGVSTTGTGSVVLASSPALVTPNLGTPTVLHLNSADQLPLSGINIIANNTIASNIAGGTANPAANTLTAVLDAIMSNSRGSILYRGASAWSALSPGTSGQVLQTGGSSADPSWTNSGGSAPFGTPATSGATCTQGQIEFDASYVYTCVATNTWRRVATSSF